MCRMSGGYPKASTGGRNLWSLRVKVLLWITFGVTETENNFTVLQTEVSGLADLGLRVNKKI